MALSDLVKVAEGYSEVFTQQSAQINERYKCDWADRITSAAALVGSANSDHSTLKCTDVSISGIGRDGTTPGFTTAFLDVTWKWPNWTVENALSDWREHWEGGGQAVTIGAGFYWSDVGGLKPIDPSVSAVKIFPTATITITGVTDALDSNAKSAILDTMGKVNSDVVTIKGYPYAAEHLLFLGVDFQEGRDYAGNVVHQMSQKYQYLHECSWNHLWNKDRIQGGSPDPAFVRVIASNGTGPYLSATFSNLDPKNW